jgi:hypothetical protein
MEGGIIIDQGAMRQIKQAEPETMADQISIGGRSSASMG